jgi:hypothetical protein
MESKADLMHRGHFAGPHLMQGLSGFGVGLGIVPGRLVGRERVSTVRRRLLGPIGIERPGADSTLRRKAPSPWPTTMVAPTAAKARKPPM